MNTLTHIRNYCPIDIDTKFHACLRKVESGWPIKKILSYYHVKRSSLYRWLNKFDKTKESLYEESHKPKSPHPNSLSNDIVNKILNLHRRNPDISFIEIWVKMVHEGFNVSASSVFRTLHRKDAYKPYKPAKKKHNKLYHTPHMIHEKWQVDVKFVPSECNVNSSAYRFYQYTMLDEATRKRVLYFTNEHSMYETVKALKMAIKEFGFKPKEIQTDNGFEFTDTVRRKTTGKYIREGDNYLERFLKLENIKHHLIKPRTPEHNGKVERSHRIDQDKFYKNLSFYSLEDLRKQGKAWNKRYNNMPKMTLGFKSPNEIEVEKLKQLLETTYGIGCKKCPTSFES